MEDTKKEVVIEVERDLEDKRRIQVHENDTINPGEIDGIFMRAYGWPSIYHFDYGNATYEVESFTFYDMNGKTYYNAMGWFEGAFGKRYRAAKFWSKQEKPKRVNGVTEDFDYAKAYADDLIFFVSIGKTVGGKPRAIVFIPFSYLKAMGFQVIKETTTNEFEVYTTLTLFTPTFQIFLTSERVKLFDNIKAAMLKELEACEGMGDLKNFVDQYKHKF